MAQHQVGPMEGVVDKQKATPGSAATTGNSMTTPQNYNSNAALDLALNTANATYYTQTRLDQMNQNDKMYALRLLQDADQFI